MARVWFPVILQHKPTRLVLRIGDLIGKVVHHLFSRPSLKVDLRCLRTRGKGRHNSWRIGLEPKRSRSHGDSIGQDADELRWHLAFLVGTQFAHDVLCGQRSKAEPQPPEGDADESPAFGLPGSSETEGAAAVGFSAFSALFMAGGCIAQRGGRPYPGGTPRSALRAWLRVRSPRSPRL
jgi:hypothetical protein